MEFGALRYKQLLMLSNMNNRLVYLTSFSLPFYFNFFTLWLLSGALLFECITVNKEKLWNFNADILVFVLYLGFLFNPISQVLICKGIQALRSCIYILGDVYFLIVFFSLHLLHKYFCFQ